MMYVAGRLRWLVLGAVVIPPLLILGLILLADLPSWAFLLEAPVAAVVAVVLVTADDHERLERDVELQDQGGGATPPSSRRVLAVVGPDDRERGGEQPAGRQEALFAGEAFAGSPVAPRQAISGEVVVLEAEDVARALGRDLDEIRESGVVYQVRHVDLALAAEVGAALGGSSRASESAPAAWSERERYIVRLVADGLTASQIALALDVSPETVQGLVHDALRKMGVRLAEQEPDAHQTRS